jgi:hypothetical protein
MHQHIDLITDGKGAVESFLTSNGSQNSVHFVVLSIEKLHSASIFKALTNHADEQYKERSV